MLILSISPFLPFYISFTIPRLKDCRPPLSPPDCIGCRHCLRRDCFVSASERFLSLLSNHLFSPFLSSSMCSKIFCALIRFSMAFVFSSLVFRLSWSAVLKQRFHFLLAQIRYVVSSSACLAFSFGCQRVRSNLLQLHVAISLKLQLATAMLCSAYWFVNLVIN